MEERYLNWDSIMEWVRVAVNCFNANNNNCFSNEDKDDVCQNSYERIVRYAVNFNPDRASLKTWVSRIAWNCANDFVNTRRMLPFEEAVYAERFYSDPETEAIERERTEWLEKNKLSLKPRELEAFEMYRDGNTHLVIAEAMNTTVNAATLLVFKAKQKLIAMARTDHSVAC